MKFITYNIQDDGGGYLTAMADFLRQEAADFIAINEANGFERNKSQRLTLLSKQVGIHYSHLTLSTQSDYHVAVLSKYPLKNIKELRPMKRAGTIATIGTELGDIAVAAVHLAPNTEDTRIDELNAVISEQSKYDLRIIMGDLNSLSARDGYDLTKLTKTDESFKQNIQTEVPRFDAINKIEQAGYTDAATLCNKQKQCTVPITRDGNTVYRNLRLDYIFISNNLKNRFASYKVIKSNFTKKASDHFPLILELDTEGRE